jgi:tellurite resistance protein
MSTPQDNPALNAELARLAESHVESARTIFQWSFDYSEESLEKIDKAIAQFHADGNTLESTVVAYGAYVGETIRRLLGGIWVQDERGVALLDRIGGQDLKASPFSWVQKRFANGMDDSIAYKYKFLKQQVGQTGRAIAPASKPEITDEESEVLVRSPLLVFLIVAAADGKVDKKELAAFQKVIAGVMMGATPLLREAMSEMLPELERHLTELQEMNPVEQLQRLASILDTHFPDEAENFKRGLLNIGIQIAESSGGFLGLGSKVSKDEAMAIVVIAQTLGVTAE